MASARRQRLVPSGNSGTPLPPYSRSKIGLANRVELPPFWKMQLCLTPRNRDISELFQAEKFLLLWSFLPALGSSRPTKSRRQEQGDNDSDEQARPNCFNPEPLGRINRCERVDTWTMGTNRNSARNAWIHERYPPKMPRRDVAVIAKRSISSSNQDPAKTRFTRNHVS
jgi:hypothetical protein